MLENLGARDIRSMSCDAVAVLFRAAVAAKGRRSDDGMRGSGRINKNAGGSAIKTIDDLQKSHNDFWEKKLSGTAH